MQTLEVKSEIHELVDNINNIKLLRTVHKFLKENLAVKNGNLWESLNDEQKQEILDSMYEAENDESSLVKVKNTI